VRSDSVYDTGRRSGARVKVKLTRAQEFVVGGYTPPEHGRKYFGTGFSDKAWQHCTPAYRRSGVPPAPSSTRLRGDLGDGAWRSHLR
jgi:hypothetical protein